MIDEGALKCDHVIKNENGNWIFTDPISNSQYTNNHWKFCPECGAARPKEAKKLWEVLRDEFVEGGTAEKTVDEVCKLQAKAVDRLVKDVLPIGDEAWVWNSHGRDICAEIRRRWDEVMDDK